MRVLLALDTSGAAAGAAVAVAGRAAAGRVVLRPAGHDRSLFTAMDEALAEAGVTRSEVEGVAVTRGPGAFTGLRVGIATAKGIAFALGVGMVGVSSLEALARGAFPWEGVVAAVFDAKKGQVYGAAYDGSTGAALVEEGAWEPAGFAARVAALGRPALFIGSGVEPFGGEFASILGGGYRTGDGALAYVDPCRVASLGWEAFERGEAVPPARFAPVYLRLSEAEENKRKGLLTRSLKI